MTSPDSFSRGKGMGQRGGSQGLLSRPPGAAAAAENLLEIQILALPLTSYHRHFEGGNSNLCFNSPRPAPGREPLLHSRENKHSSDHVEQCGTAWMALTSQHHGKKSDTEENILNYSTKPPNRPRVTHAVRSEVTLRGRAWEGAERLSRAAVTFSFWIWALLT